MIHRAEDIVHVASATVARWQAEAVEIIQNRMAAQQLGMDAGPHEDQLRRAYEIAVNMHLHGKQNVQGRS